MLLGSSAKKMFPVECCGCGCNLGYVDILVKTPVTRFCHWCRELAEEEE